MDIPRDCHYPSGRLVQVMNELLALGIPLRDVIARVMANAATAWGSPASSAR
jgi:predicted amidohydrolase